jgi:hypothetical protein
VGITVDIRSDIKSASRFYRELNQTGINRATANALNVVIRVVRNETITEVSKIRNLRRKGPVRKNIQIFERASNRKQRAVVGARSHAAFSLKEFKGTKQTELGVEVAPKGKRKLISHAFGPGMKGTGRGKNRRAARPAVLGGHVWRRKGASRLPIQKLYGPSITTGFVDRIVKQQQRRVIERQWRRTLDEKMNDQLRKLRAKHGRRAFT